MHSSIFLVLILGDGVRIPQATGLSNFNCRVDEIDHSKIKQPNTFLTKKLFNYSNLNRSVKTDPTLKFNC